MKLLKFLKELEKLILKIKLFLKYYVVKILKNIFITIKIIFFLKKGYNHTLFFVKKSLDDKHGEILTQVLNFSKKCVIFLQYYFRENQIVVLLEENLQQDIKLNNL